MDWSTLFERGADSGADVETVRETLGRRREDADASGADGGTDDAGEAPPSPSPARVVADADVLAADVLVGGEAREALEAVWRHSFVTLIASDRLLSDAEATIAAISTPDLGADWRALLEGWREPVSHPPGDHPGLASAYRGGAMHLLSFDEALTSARAGTAIGGRVPISVREPRAFATVFDAESLYAEVVGGAYPGPDRQPRS